MDQGVSRTSQKASTQIELILSALDWGSRQRLRHDTVLYAKQSYSAGSKCFSPEGYVEPYPEVYCQLSELTTAMQQCINQSSVQEFHKKRLADF